VLFPGDYYVTDKRLRISTLLGSCVSVCLYDPVNRVAGMNHFLLGNKNSSDDPSIAPSKAGRYGVHAMEHVITGMLKLGARREHLKAKVCGGSSLLTPGDGEDGLHCVGKANCAFIQEFLSNDGISIVSSDLGGAQGRIVHFDTHDYSLYVKKVKKPPLSVVSLGPIDKKHPQGRFTS